MTFTQTLIISLVTAIATGFLSILGVILTLRQNNKQLKIQTTINQQQQLQNIIDNRPELEIVDFTEKDLAIHAPVENNDSIIECLYSGVEENPNNKKFVVLEYKLKNIGNEMIEFIDFIPLQKGTYFYNIKEIICGEQLKIECLKDRGEKCITYYGDKFRAGNEFKIRVWYCKDRIPQNVFTVTACIAYKSFNKKYWRQNLHIPSKTLEESILISEEEYKRLTTRIE